MLSDFINEGRNAFIPNLDTHIIFFFQPVPPVVCGCVLTRHCFRGTPSSVSLTGPSHRVASLYSHPNETTAQLTPLQPCQHSPRLRPTIWSPDSDEKKRAGSKEAKTIRKNKERQKGYFFTKQVMRRTKDVCVIMCTHMKKKHGFTDWSLKAKHPVSKRQGI